MASVFTQGVEGMMIRDLPSVGEKHGPAKELLLCLRRRRAAKAEKKGEEDSPPRPPASRRLH